MAPVTGFHHRRAARELTDRQREVLSLIARGRTNSEIAAELGISFDTAKSHVSDILARLGVDSREEAADAWRSDSSGRSRLRRMAPGFVVAGAGKAAAIAAAVILVAGVTAAVFVATRDDGEPGVQAPLAPADPVPAGLQPDATRDWTYQPGTIHDARVDLAARLSIDPAEVKTWAMRQAFWSGCIGATHRADEDCDAVGVHGYMVDFAAQSRLYRYHVGWDRFVAIDWARDVVIDDGQRYMEDGIVKPLPDRSRYEFARGDAAVGDLELRTGVPRDDWMRVFVQQVTFEDGCLGFARATPVVCRPGPVPGAILEFAHGAERHRYHVSLQGMVAIDLEPGRAVVSPDPEAVARTRQFREHLAGRFSVPVEQIAVNDYRRVTWPDTCLAIRTERTPCADTTEVDGFWISLTPANHPGYEFTYHGRDDGSFELGQPSADEETFAGRWKRERD